MAAPSLEETYRFERSPSGRQKWRRLYGGLLGEKLLEPRGPAAARRDDGSPDGGENADDVGGENADDVGGGCCEDAADAEEEAPNSPRRPDRRSAAARRDWWRLPPLRPVVGADADGQSSGDARPEAVGDGCGGSDATQAGTKGERARIMASSTTDRLFDGFAVDGRVHVAEFVKAVCDTGLLRSDPRLKPGLEALGRDTDPAGTVTREHFSRCVGVQARLLLRALQGCLAIPRFRSFASTLERIFLQCRRETHDQSDQAAAEAVTGWGLAVCTVDGQRLSLGASALPFRLGHVSRLLSHALASHALGAARLHARLEAAGQAGAGVDPEARGCSLSPLSDSGSLLVAALLQAALREQSPGRDALQLVLEAYGQLAGPEGATQIPSSSPGPIPNRLQAVKYIMKDRQCFPERTDADSAMELLVQEFVRTFALHPYDSAPRRPRPLSSWSHESEGYRIMNLLLAAYRGDVASLRRMVLAGVHPGLADYDGRTALHLAASEGRLNAVRFLLETARADCHARDRWGSTPLHEAVRYAHQAVVALLSSHMNQATVLI
uniref:glutaminase n=1 Tax=Petromyzon marinus TaxID=7757 RepID=A0AAJ7XGC3_PETMA|nr:glutaminase liver isoform, mitochondrial-like [Petromyzon marinus]